MNDISDLIKAIQVLSLNPGDVIVIKTTNYVDAVDMQKIQSFMKEICPDNETIILANGAEIEVIKQSELREPA